jgi:hypothetical protein
VVWILWNFNLTEKLNSILLIFNSSNITIPDLSHINIIYSSGFLLFSLIAFFYLMAKTNEMIISVRRMYWALIWLVLLSLSMINFDSGFFEAFTFAAAPLSIIIAFHFLSHKNVRVLDFLFTLWIIAVFVTNVFF